MKRVISYLNTCKIHRCTKCEKKETTLPSMKDHVISAHDSWCGKCNLQSNSNETLDVHKGKHHTDIMNCGLCGKAFEKEKT